MQIPPLKKSTFYIITVLVLLVGIILGALFFDYVFFKNRDIFCELGQPPKVNTEFTQKQIQAATSITSNRAMFGKVIYKEASLFTIELTIVNPLDTKNSTTTTIKVPFDKNKDEVIKIEQGPETPVDSVVKTTNSSFSNIRVGDRVLVKFLDGKKTIYLLPSS